MLDVSRNDVASCTASDFLRNEILRVGASAEEMSSAQAFVASEASLDPRAYDVLPPRMRRLVDLVAVAPSCLSESIFDTPWARVSSYQGIGTTGAAIRKDDSSVGGCTAPASG